MCTVQAHTGKQVWGGRSEEAQPSASRQQLLPKQLRYRREASSAISTPPAYLKLGGYKAGTYSLLRSMVGLGVCTEKPLTVGEVNA